MNKSDEKSNVDIQTLIAREFLKYLIPFFLLLISLGIIATIYPHFQPIRFWNSIIGFIIVCVIPYSLSRKKKFTAALNVIIWGVHLPILLGTILNNGVEAPIYVAFMITLVLIGWVSSSKLTALYTVLLLSYGFLLAFLQQNNYLPVRDYPLPVARITYYAVYFGAVAIVTIFGNRLLHNTLRKSQDRERLLSTTFRAIPDALLLLDDKGALLETNFKADLLLETVREEQEIPSLCEMALESNDISEVTLIELLSEHKYSLQNLRLRLAKCKHKKWFSLSASPFTQSNNSESTVVLIRDITTEVEQEYNFAQAQKMDAVGQLASGIAHDFNNMLGGIQGASDILLPEAREDQKVMLNLISAATDKAAKLTKELLVFSRKAPRASTAIDVHSIIEETSFLLKRTIDKRVKVSTELDADHAQVIGDDTLIQSALMNMGINASHAMPEGGTLTFKTSVKELDTLFCAHSEFEIEPGKFLSIEIIDTGSGMSLEVQKRIFEPFFTTKEVGKGTGLGMAAVYSMVVKHKGAITIYSEVGTGTAFHILLPLTEKNIETQKQSLETVVKGTGTVLVVDDEEFIRITTTELLRNIGYTVFSVQNGQEALDFLNEHTVDLVILDMIMPVMNGRETFARIIEKNGSQKVVLSSGFSKDEDVVRMKEKGLFGFVHKPYQRTELSQIVADAMRS